MTVKVAINGMGRIGRMVLRGLFESNTASTRNDIAIVAINSPGTAMQSAHLTQYDSVHGKFSKDISHSDTSLIIDGKNIAYSSFRDPADAPWGQYDIDIVLECSGKFNKAETASKHLHAGAKKVLISAPASGVDCVAVYGVNHKNITSGDAIISNASCTTNALAPVVQVLDDAFGIEQGFMTTVHAYTNDQNNLDNSHQDLRRARACGVSMIPTSTGAARSISQIIPHLAGKLDGISIRVPTTNVSMVDLVATLQKSATVQMVNDLMAKMSNNEFKGIVGYCDKDLVSIDFNGTPQSIVFDATQTHMVGKQMVRIAGWYDNEWAFSLRMLDMAQYIGKL